MTPQQAHGLTAFFFFILMDDREAFFLASQASDLLQSRTYKKINFEKAAIIVCEKLLSKKELRAFSGPQWSKVSSWTLSEEVDLANWTQFLKYASPEEKKALLWSLVLEIKPALIAEALGVTVGTIEWRMSQALQKLIHGGRPFGYLLPPISRQKLIWRHYSQTLESDFRSLENLSILADSEAPPRASIKNHLEEGKQAITSVRNFKKIQFSPETLNTIFVSTTYFQSILRKTKFQEWSELAKFGFEMGVTVTLALLILVFVPWGKVMSLRDHFLNQPKDLVVVERDSPVVHPDAVVSEESVKTPPVVSPPEPATQQTQIAVATPTPSRPVEMAAKAKKERGVLFRGNLLVKDVQFVGADLVAQLASLGARKAGDVDLGWKRGRSLYFHFLVDETKREDVEKIFSKAGQFDLKEEKHPRIPPIGKIRMIIVVDPQ